jgi:hypothetical protein
MRYLVKYIVADIVASLVVVIDDVDVDVNVNAIRYPTSIIIFAIAFSIFLMLMA